MNATETDEYIEWYEHLAYYANRSHGPCLIRTNGDVAFSYNRHAGPTHISANGYVCYFNTLKRRLHRTDGPAIIYPDGSKSYWIDHEWLSPDDFFMQYGAL